MPATSPACGHGLLYFECALGCTAGGHLLVGTLGHLRQALRQLFRHRYTQAQVDAFCDSLRLFRIGYSWGGPVSLVMPYDLASMRSRATAHLRPGHLVRFAIGLEAVQDLQRDLAQALAQAF